MHPDLSVLDPVSFPPVVTAARPGDAPGLDRRSFLRLAALAGGGFALALYLRGPDAAAAESAAATAPGAGGDFTPSLFIRITPAGAITVVAANPECGQGVKTAFPMLIVEELDAPWEQVKIEQADFDPRLGRQAAAGSRGTPTHYEPYRRLGATARALLVTAAAARWSVPATELSTPGDARVVHAPSGRAATYGELASAAAALPVPDEKTVPLKEPSSFRLLGRRIGGVDNPRIVVGAPLFGLDVRRPGQLFATFLKCPVFGGVVRSADLAAARAAHGVRAVFEVKAPGVASGVAVVADSTWRAFQARDLLKIEWDEGRATADSDAAFAAAATRLHDAPLAGDPLRAAGDFAAAHAASAVRVDARYEYPFLSHANLEPQNCTALHRPDGVELWAPTQSPSGARDAAAKALGVAPESVVVHMTRIGGGFGRRLTNDFAAEAAAIAREVSGNPVQLVWTRADDLQHDWYRPGGFHAFRGGVDADGRVVAWGEHFVTYAAGYDTDKVAGVAGLAAAEFPGRLVPNVLIHQSPLPNGIPLGPWRAPRTSAQCFAQQSFLDELAHAAGRDPVEFRLALLAVPAAPAPAGERGPVFDNARMAGVVRLAAEKSGWGAPGEAPWPRGRGRGIAFQFSHLGYVAIVAEVTVSPAGELVIDRVVVAADVGRQIINPSGGENQSEGSVVDGISSALVQRITIEGGRVAQSGFADMPLLRIDQAPKRIETHFLLTDNPPTGLGEPVIPPVPPALGNAIFAATGHRVRRLPFNAADLSWS